MSLAGIGDFHPHLSEWFAKAIGSPTPLQQESWEAIKKGQNLLIEAPTGSGKTLAAFFGIIDELYWQSLSGTLPDDRVHTLYISPLKALAADITTNLENPLLGIAETAKSNPVMHLQVGADVFTEIAPVPITVGLRTGDTTSYERTRMQRHPPHILATTPESFYLLLTSQSGRQMLQDVKYIVVDEVHALLESKRGHHLLLSLARLGMIEQTDTMSKPCVIALSATQKPVSVVADFLNYDERHKFTVVSSGHHRPMTIEIETPHAPLAALASNKQWESIHERLNEIITRHQTTLVFVNNRRLTERLSRDMTVKYPQLRVAAHHGSLSHKHRSRTEAQLRAGALDVVVATSALELGIDIGSVDIVCQIGATSTIALAMQRFGRSGRGFGAKPKGVFFPLTCEDLTQCVALHKAITTRDMEELHPANGSLDVLSQQIAAETSVREKIAWRELFTTFKRCRPYREITESDFAEVLNMLSEGYMGSHARQEGLIHWDKATGMLLAKPATRLTAILNGGCIPDQFEHDLILQPEQQKVGSVPEDFVLESMAGDVLQLGVRAYRILGVQDGKILVADAAGQAANLPFWLGEAKGRSDSLSHAVSELQESYLAVRGPCDTQLDSAAADSLNTTLAKDWGVPESIAAQLTEYFERGYTALGVMPSQSTIVIERFFDEADETHFVIHAPFGSRINRAWALALRKKFCRRFNFELQAVALDNGLMLSLGATHSFGMTEPLTYLNSQNLRETLTQALIDTPIFPTYFRWCASTALAIKRNRTQGRLPPALQRANTEDLLAMVFPDQLACAENIVAERNIPDHPLVTQTFDDCLQNLMDIDGLVAVISALEEGSLNVVAVDTPQPSSFTEALVAARPYAFVDDAPLEERRSHNIQTRAVATPVIPPVPFDYELVVSERERITPNFTNLGSLLAALQFYTVLPLDFIAETAKGLVTVENLIQERRLVLLYTSATGLKSGPCKLVTSAEYLQSLPALWQSLGAGDLSIETNLHSENNEDINNSVSDESPDAERSLTDILRSWLSLFVALTPIEIRSQLGLPEHEILTALNSLEAEGFVMRDIAVSKGGDVANYWMPKHLVSRLQKRRKAEKRNRISSITITKYRRFLNEWQGVGHEHARPLETVLEQLSLYPAPALTWEKYILPARVPHFESGDLDDMCLSGQLQWIAHKKAISFVLTHQTDEIGRIATALTTPKVPIETLGGKAKQLLQWIANQGSCFSYALFSATSPSGHKLLGKDLVEAISELMTTGWLRADSFDAVRYWIGLSAGLAPEFLPEPKEIPGRWYLHQKAHAQLAARDSPSTQLTAPDEEEFDRETYIRTYIEVLLRRWGVLYRGILQKEQHYFNSVGGEAVSHTLPKWQELALMLRRMEEAGEVLAGRFIAANLGEQYASEQAYRLLSRVEEKPKMSVASKSVTASAAKIEAGLDVLTLADPVVLKPSILSMSSLGPDERTLGGSDTAIDDVRSVPKSLVVTSRGTPIAALSDGQITTLRQGTLTPQVSVSGRNSTAEDEPEMLAEQVSEVAKDMLKRAYKAQQDDAHRHKSVQKRRNRRLQRRAHTRRNTRGTASASTWRRAHKTLYQ